MNQPELSILIPCFNEEKNIAATVHSVVSYMSQNWSGKSFELVIINDGSIDGTKNVIEDLAKKHSSLRLISYSPNRGRGYAIKTGIKQSLGKQVVLLDADLSYDVDHVGEILRKFEEDPTIDVVVVSPYMKGGVVRGVPAFRLALSKTANWILASFFSDQLSTVTCVVRGYNGPLIRSLPLYESGKELHVEILRAVILIGAHVVEIPGRLIWKTKARRKVSLKVISSAKDHFIYAILMRPARYLVRGGLLLLAIGLYESIMMARLVFNNYNEIGEGWGRTLWKALADSFGHSPHTAVIAITAMIISFQMLSFAGLVQIMKIHQEEKMRHLIGLYRKG